MGLAASQARYLSLAARKSNIEYEGQQINQQRTQLSEQSSAYYAEFLDMSVPTPPSTNDYTKTTYSFTLGTDTMTINSVKPNGEYYTINATYKEAGHYLESKGNSHISKENGEYKIGENLPLRKLSEVCGQELSAQECADYLTAVRNYFPDYADHSDEDLMEEVYVYFTESTDGSRHNTPHFVMSWQGLGSIEEGEEGWSQTYDYMLNGSYNATKVFTDAKITFDSSGMISEIWLPQYDENDNIIGSIKYPVNAATATDTEAYDNAYNKYEYEKYLYDKKMQDLNAQTEIIQQQDKNLELRLEQLESEHTAIKTEMEAVQKVIKENIESSFKIFNA